MNGRYTYKIGVSGSAQNNCAPGAFARAREVGRQIALSGAVCVTGDTIGIPHAAAHGAKAAGGVTAGISPAMSRQEHLRKYRLPNDEMDLVIYTGFQYSGRNLLFIRACDAVIFVCGRIGTLNEFTIAFEDKKPIGILTETGGMSDEIEHIISVAQRGSGKVVYDSDPKKLVQKVMAMVEEEECIREKGKKACQVLIGKRKKANRDSASTAHK